MENTCCGATLLFVQVMFSLFLHMELYHAGYETNKNKIWINDKIEPHNTMLHVEV